MIENNGPNRPGVVYNVLNEAQIIQFLHLISGTERLQGECMGEHEMWKYRNVFLLSFDTHIIGWSLVSIVFSTATTTIRIVISSFLFFRFRHTS